jgi:2'-5' RNA ligase superfamily
VRTVELLGDEGLDRDGTDGVAAGSGRVSSLARHRHPTNRPHLTLASAEQFPPAAAVAIAGALRVLPIQVRLDGLHFFGAPAGVLAWAVDDGGALRELQAQVWSALDGASAIRSMNRACGRRTSAWRGGCWLARRRWRPRLSARSWPAGRWSGHVATTA